MKYSYNVDNAKPAGTDCSACVTTKWPKREVLLYSWLGLSRGRFTYPAGNLY